MARLLHVTAEQLVAVRAAMRAPMPDGPSWKAARPEAPGEAVAPWFSLTPSSPSFDGRIGGRIGDRIGDADVELTATMATFGGVTGPRSATAGLPDGAEPPAVVLGGNPVAPGSAAGPTAMRSRQCAIRLRVAAEGLASDRQCLVLAAVCGLHPGSRVQVLLADHTLAELPVNGEDRLAVLLDVPADGMLRLELWLRLASHDAAARLGVRGIVGHLL
ncbi:hypothetical protein [Paraliomyxa miuraensis]|uniref:hypothetical protein n=1 Tax=Paraliomyxa miuraensis TaxID=376150 RepID=UPI002258FA20|nr:hypothetical protein [Paraliomyxa miuraensis]MCX4241027.1 hypothetical protein [Paraliomyxa miuraensis]